MAHHLLHVPSSGGAPLSPLIEEGRLQGWYEIVEIAFRVATLAFVLLGIIFESLIFLTIASVLGLISFLFYLNSQYGPDDNWVGWVLDSVCPRRRNHSLASGDHPGGSGISRTSSAPTPPNSSDPKPAETALVTRSASAPAGFPASQSPPSSPMDDIEEEVLSPPPLSAVSGGRMPGYEDHA